MLSVFRRHDLRHGLGALTLLILTGGAARAAGEVSFGVPRGMVSRMVSNFGQIRDHVSGVLSALPHVPQELAQTIQTILASSTHRGTLALAAGVILILLVLPKLLARVPPLGALRPDFPERSLAGAGRRLAFDVVDLAVMVLLAIILADAVFSSNALIDRFCLALIDTTLRLRLAMFIPLAVLRPGESVLRLVPANDVQVSRAMPLVWVVVGLAASFITLIPVLFEAGIPAVHTADEPWRAGQALAVIVGSLVSLGALCAVERFFSAAQPAQPAMRMSGLLLVGIFWAAWTYGVISLDFDFYYAFAGLAILAAVTLLVDRFLLLATAQMSKAADGLPDSAMAYAAALCRCARVAALATAFILLSRYLLSQALVMFTIERWANIEGGLVSGLLYLVGGYVSYELTRVWARIKFGVRTQPQVPGIDDGDDPEPASRLSTIMPLVQGFVGVTILGVAIIAALSEIGVNITPLLAGAGIFGLAISFGSQSLVRDIVAGLFFMVDDAFRVGEYIEAGRLRGTVERISLRSLRLRHHNGQMHTVPFGQLGSITNHSRDWLTVKFNLRFAGDTDLEKVRKLVKRIGQDLLNDPEIGREFLLPLKMQGIADVVENTLILRFKFTVKPGKPTIVQREALKQMVLAFRQSNISFGSPGVIVQGDGERQKAIEGAAGAAIINAAKPAAAE